MHRRWNSHRQYVTAFLCISNRNWILTTGRVAGSAHVLQTWTSKPIWYQGEIGCLFKCERWRSLLNPSCLTIIHLLKLDQLQTPHGTAEKSKALVDDLKKLDSDINYWKSTVPIFDYVPKQDDGTSAYRTLMKDLKDLKEHLQLEYAFRRHLLYIVRLIANLTGIGLVISHWLLTSILTALLDRYENCLDF